METTIKITHFTHDFKALLSDFIRKALISISFGRFSIAFHSIALLLFNNQVRLDAGKYIIQHFTTGLPIIYRAIKFLFLGPSIAGIFGAAKCILEPNNKRFIATSNFNQGLPSPAGSPISLPHPTDVKATFSIYNASQIGKLLWSMICVIYNASSHIISFLCDVYDYCIMNTEKGHRERLNEKAPHSGDATVWTPEETRGGKLKCFPAFLRKGHKSNRMVLNSAALRLGQSLRTTEDELTRDMLAGTAAFINCDQGFNGDNPTEITRADIDNVVAELMDNDAMMIGSNIEGENKFGTAPVRDAYFALCSTRLIGDLDAINGFINKAQYPNQMDVLRSEWGTASNVRFLVSSLGSISQNASANNNSVYNVFVTGMEAYATVEQNEYSSQFIYRSPIHDGPLALNATVGYKFATVPRILNDLWVLNLRCTRA